jgi:ABC-type transport system involved in multi-copper enzyme maturation permease subunit
MRDRARLADVAAVEAIKLARQPATYVLLAIVVGYAAVLALSLSSVLRAPSGSGLDASALLVPLRADALGFVANILEGVAVIALVVLAAQMAGAEFSRGTLRTLLVSRARRSDVAWSKILVLLLASLALGLLVSLGSWLTVLSFQATTGEDLLRGAGAGRLAALAGRAAAGFAAWALLALGATLASRSLGFGLGTTLGTLVAGDVLTSLLAKLGTAGVWASRVVPNVAISAVSGDAPVDASAWGWIVPSLLFWVVGANVVALLELRRLDVIAATK